ncbi:hypothetical protein GCM10009603_23040 [Nocardiopsis exhalans]
MILQGGAVRWIPGGPALVLVLLMLTVLLSDSAGPGPAWFGARGHETGDVLLSLPVELGQRVELVHTHSVHRRPVHEVYSVSVSDGLLMEEIRFDAHGANLPSGPETIGGVTTTFERVGSGYRADHHGRPLGTVRMVVGSGDVDHRLVVADKEIRLLDLAEPGTRIELYTWTHLRDPGE